MVYLIYLGVAALIVWSVWYVCRNLRRQVKGACDGDCAGCADRGGCDAKKEETE